MGQKTVRGFTWEGYSNHSVFSFLLGKKNSIWGSLNANNLTGKLDLVSFIVTDVWHMTEVQKFA